jgi:hypothetical protein
VKPEEHERWHEILSRGFDAGNFANAYEGEDYQKTINARAVPKIPAALRSAYHAAFTLGFFASYEAHEIPDDHRAAYWTAYRSASGRECLRLGFIDPRDESEAS